MAECAALTKFAHDGGSIIASFETSLFNEQNERRNDFELPISSAFMRRVNEERESGNGYMGRIERKHPILEGFFRHGLASRRKVASADSSGRKPRDDSDSTIRKLSTGTRVSSC